MEVDNVKPYDKEKNHHDNKIYLTAIIVHKIQWLYFQYVLSYAYDTITQHTYQPLLKSISRVFYVYGYA